MTYHSDAHVHGFLLAEIVPWLREQSVQIEREIKAKPELLTPDYATNPDLEYFLGGYTLNDAASLILGFNPHRRDNRVSESDNDFTKKRNEIALSFCSFYRDSMEAQRKELDSDGSMKGSLLDNLMITAEEVEIWCNQNSYFWCVPTKRQVQISKTVLSTVDATALTNEINELRDRLKNESDNHTFLRKAAEERDSWKEAHSVLNSRLSEVGVELAEAMTTIDSLKADLMQGKSKSFMLELLGGLVTSVLYVDIFKQGNIEVGKVTSALEFVGLKLTPETVSSYLKYAATRLVESGKADAAIKYLEDYKK